MEQFCRVVVEYGKLKTEGPNALGSNIAEIIESDKRYQKMIPRNGKHFTFRILDVNDREIDEDFVLRAVWESIRKWTKKPIDLPDFKQAKNGEYADFKIRFRTPENDELGHMTPNTLMYHFMPISNYNSPERGLCVVNPNYFWTSHGKPLPMWKIDPVHYTPDSNSWGATFDFDAVYGHELGHGLGLPHDTEPNEIMSTPYMFLNEFVGERSIYRMQRKYGFKTGKISFFTRWWKINRVRSERDNYGSGR